MLKYFSISSPTPTTTCYTVSTRRYHASSSATVQNYRIFLTYLSVFLRVFAALAVLIVEVVVLRSLLIADNSGLGVRKDHEATAVMASHWWCWDYVPSSRFANLIAEVANWRLIVGIGLVMLWALSKRGYSGIGALFLASSFPTLFFQ